MPKSACYKCNERHLYCHQHCEKYIEEQKKNQERKTVIQNERKKVLDMNLYWAGKKRKRR